MSTLLNYTYRYPFLFRNLFWTLPLLFLAATRRIHRLDWVAAAVLLALVPWLTRRTGVNARLTGPLLALLSAGVLGLLVSYNFYVSLPAFLTLLGSTALFFAIVSSGLPPRLLAEGTVLVVVLVAVLYAVTWFAGGGLEETSLNALAGVLEVAFLPALVLTARSRGPDRVFWAAVVVFLTAGLLATGSRGAWIGLTTALGIWGLLGSPQARKIGAVLLGSALGVTLSAVAVALLVPAGASRFGLVVESFASRWAVYRNSLYLWTDYPFTGLGLGAFPAVYARYQLLIEPVFLYYAHNFYLVILLGMGLPGLAALGWLMVRLYRFVAQLETVQASLPPSSDSGPLFRAGWLGMTAVFLHGLIDSPHFSNSLWAMPFFFAGLGLVVLSGNRILHRLGYPPLPQWRLLPADPPRWLVVAAAIVLLAAGILLARPTAAAGLVNLGALAQTRAALGWLDEPARQAGFSRAEDYFHCALQISPRNPAAHHRLGMLALNRGDFSAAIEHLEQAYAVQPGNEAIVKALGLAYRGSGQVETGNRLLEQLSAYSGATTGPDIWPY